jgi:hypothetical protein
MILGSSYFQVKRMKRQISVTKPNPKRIFVCTLLMALMLSAAAVSIVNAEEDRQIVPPPYATPIENATTTSDENQPVFALDDNATTISPADGDNPNLYETQDDENATAPIQPPRAEDQLVTTQDNAIEENNLLGAQTESSYAMAIMGAMALAIVAACVVAVIVVKRRKAAIA